MHISRRNDGQVAVAAISSHSFSKIVSWCWGFPLGKKRQIFYIRTDHIGRPVFATNDLGVKVWEASYQPGLRPFAAETLHRSVSGTPLTPSAGCTW
ncbi:MAG: hypothetical protein WA822_16975, partial [Albidovulum sp.]